MNNQVHYKGIIHERTEDAPFMGALVIAVSCNNNCQGCFNQHLRDASVRVDTPKHLVGQVLSNIFNDGIILGGLEWSECPAETISLIKAASDSGLEVMLHTGLTEPELYERIPREYLHGCYVKFGGYDASLASAVHKSHGVRLASTNQYIKLIR